MAGGVALTLRDQVNVTVVQGLPDAQKQIDFEAGLLIVKFVREIDTKHVRCQLLDVTFASFEKGTHRVSFAGVDSIAVSHPSVGRPSQPSA